MLQWRKDNPVESGRLWKRLVAANNLICDYVLDLNECALVCIFSNVNVLCDYSPMLSCTTEYYPRSATLIIHSGTLIVMRRAKRYFKTNLYV